MSSYTRDLVRATVAKCFPSVNTEEVLNILDRYGTEVYERERERVQIAILKLSEGDRDKLLVNVEIAKRDYRDVLAYAEYPEEMSKPSWSDKSWEMTDKEEMRLIRDRDRRQYDEWLKQ